MAITDQGILMTLGYLMNCKTDGKTENVLQKREICKLSEKISTARQRLVYVFWVSS